MKKITQFSLVLILFLLLTTLYLVASATAQTGMLPGMNGGQCDPNPACVTGCCGQCDPNPACVENCCPGGPNDQGGPNDHMNTGNNPGGHMGSCPEGPGYDACIAAQSAASATNHHPGDTCMQHPAGPARDNCYSNQPGPGHHDPNMPPPGGQHHDPNMAPPGGEHHDPNMPPPGGPNHPPGGCDPNLAPDAGGCPDGFQGKPHHDGPKDHGGPNDQHMSGSNDHGGPNDHMRK